MRASIITAVLAATGAGASLADLPLTGTTSSGQRWRLETARSHAAASWCLSLRYTTDVVIDGDPFNGGVRSCGPAPAPRVSGITQVDCAHHSVFVFGGARSGVRAVSLRQSTGAVLKARKAKLPARSHFTGFSFMVVGDTRRLPATVEATGAGQRVLVRLPSRSSLCQPYPGAPSGGEPFLEFGSQR